MKSAAPVVSVDIVLLTILDGVLHVGLTKRECEPFAGQLALPGGRFDTEKDGDEYDAAVRILREKTGVTSPHLEQLQTFAGANRDPRGWTVSIAHFAVVHAKVADTADARFTWKPVDSVRTLPFDHARILQAAVTRVRTKSLYSSLPVHLMPETFTLGQLQAAYEVLVNSPLDKRSFRRRMDDLDLLVEVPGAVTTGAGHRPAQQYRVKDSALGRLAVSDSNLGRKAA
jgi:8-oxo-dGTP diphosphatase